MLEEKFAAEQRKDAEKAQEEVSFGCPTHFSEKLEHEGEKEFDERASSKKTPSVCSISILIL